MPPATAALNPLVAGDDDAGRGGTGLDWLWPMEKGIEDERGAKDCCEDEEDAAGTWPAL